MDSSVITEIMRFSFTSKASTVAILRVLQRGVNGVHDKAFVHLSFDQIKVVTETWGKQ